MSSLASLASEALEELRALVRAEIECALAARDQEPDRRWLSVREAGTYLGCSERAVHMRIRRGRIPPEAVHHSGRRLILDRFVLDHTLESGP
jgi:hypothetical protein